MEKGGTSSTNSLHKPLYGQSGEEIGYNCPTCNAVLPRELMAMVWQNNSVICERCGCSLTRNDFR